MFILYICLCVFFSFSHSIYFYLRKHSRGDKVPVRRRDKSVRGKALLGNINFSSSTSSLVFSLVLSRGARDTV